MKPSVFNSSFMFFLVLLTKFLPITSSKNESITMLNITMTKAAPLLVIVTDEVILKICYQTTVDRENCRYTMDRFKGKPLFPKALESVMADAQKHAKRTAKKIWRLYDSVKDDKSELKKNYYKRLKKYTNAMNLMNKAKKFMRLAKPSSVKMYTSLVLAQVRSCDRKMARQVYGSSDLSKDSKKFIDLISMIDAICSEVSRKQY